MWEIAQFQAQAQFPMGAFAPPVPKAGGACYFSDHPDIAFGFFRCSEAAIRSKIWDPDTFASDVPPLGAVLADQRAGLDEDEMIETIRVADQETLH